MTLFGVWVGGAGCGNAQYYIQAPPSLPNPRTCTSLPLCFVQQRLRNAHALKTARHCSQAPPSLPAYAPARHFTNALSDGGSASLASAGRLSRPLLPAQNKHRAREQSTLQ
eukprot:scaffold117251_cov21-Tisochrysis_lutea.AAC.2